VPKKTIELCATLAVPGLPCMEIILPRGIFMEKAPLAADYKGHMSSGTA
jgi:hypothetical protein